MVRGCVGWEMECCACEARFLEGFQRFLGRRWEEIGSLASSWSFNGHHSQTT